MAATTLGVVFLPNWPPERLHAVARAADEAGLDELWLWEDCFKESGIAAAAAALAWTERLSVGVGLLPVPLRNVAMTAMEVATLERLFPGRSRIAVGHGVQEWMGQVGARVESPLTLLREYVTALRSLLAGERVTSAGRYVQLDDVALDWPPAAPLPVLVGAVGPKTVELTGEVADGTVLTGGTTPDEVRAALLAVDRGRATAARTGPHHVTVYLIAATGADAEERVQRELAAWSLDPETDVAVAGDAAAVAGGVRRWAEAGADTVVIQPTGDEPDVEGLIRFVTDEVKPLVDESA
jgi:alkanesulfonate monooxygenase SsuD/methylene tetrahydromethanopterin reductase-like flavin-dependent oxidoreductase (luciferase family)